MSACPACKAEVYVDGAPCKQCGYVAAAVPELDIPKPPPPKPKAPPKKAAEEAPLELAVDMNDVRNVAQTSLSSLAPGARTSAPPSRPQVEQGYAPMAAAGASPRTMQMPSGVRSIRPGPMESDDELEARTLAGYGESPKNAFVAPFYAYKVFKRQQELKRALVGRKEEAQIAATRAEDSLVALAERARPIAVEDPQSARTLEELKRAEELMRSRDHSLAREQDAHAERLRSIDLRIAGVEAELVAAQAAERQALAELADAQAALQRVEARHKRAEIELRNQAAARTRVGR